MTTYSGYQGIVKTGAASDVVAVLTGFALEQAAEALDASVIDGNDLRTIEQGQNSFTAAIDVLYDPADAGVLNLELGTIVNVELYPTGVGDQSFIGDALIVGASLPIEVSGMIAQNITVEGDGLLTIAAGGLPAGTITEVTTGAGLTEVTSGDYITEV